MTFLDTSGLVAYFDARDTCHAQAVAAWRRVVSGAGGRLLSNLIIVETVTLLRRRAGFHVAHRVGERLLSGAVGEVVHVGPAVLESAWVLFEKYQDHDLSLTDCASFALMRERRIQKAFTFDEDFRNAGFDRV